jgi:hypothetical protein
MSEPEEDPCGLMCRLQIAMEQFATTEDLADALHVPNSTVEAILGDPFYVPIAEDYENIVTFLPFIPERTHRVGETATWQVYFTEKPLWTEDDIGVAQEYFGAAKVVIIVCDPVYPDRVKSEGPFDLDTWTVQQAIEAATQGDRLTMLTIASYVPYLEFPYTAR